MAKIGRNSPCPCGSGKKYKRCCADHPHPGLDARRIAGVAINASAKQLIYVTNDMLINQLRRDAPLIADSFDRLHDSDLREMSELLGSASALLLTGFHHAAEDDDELRTVAAQLAFNAVNTFISSVTLLRNGFYLQAAMLVRSILETLATVLHLTTTPSDLPRLAENALEIKTTLPSAKLHALRIYRYDWISRPRFSVPDADYVPELAVDDVQRALESKNSRHQTYLRKCDEVWLVVSINADRLSMTFEIGDVLTETVYETPFARLFFLQHMTQHLSELSRLHGRRDA